MLGFIGCVGIQTKTINGLIEVEGQTYKPLKEICGVCMVDIEKWKKVDEGPFEVKEGGNGLLADRPYSYAVYRHPQEPATHYMVIYILEPFKRAERIGVFILHPLMGPQIIAILDRYKNTNTWYFFDGREYDKQHPNPARYSRKDAS